MLRPAGRQGQRWVGRARQSRQAQNPGIACADPRQPAPDSRKGQGPLPASAAAVRPPRSTEMAQYWTARAGPATARSGSP
jgi:hypothetical protein